MVSGWAGGSATGQVVASAGGPSVASKIACHEFFHGQAVGRWMVMRLAEVAMGAGMPEMRRRIVAVVALVCAPLAMVPAARARVECDDLEDEKGGVGVEFPGWQVGESGALEASKTCSMMAWPRWVLSAATVSIWSSGTVAWNAWNRQTANRDAWSGPAGGPASGMWRTTRRSGDPLGHLGGREGGEG